MWDIIRLPRLCFCADLCPEDKNEMIFSINSIIFLCKISCDYWLTHLRPSGSEIVWSMGFELDFSVGMVLGALF